VRLFIEAYLANGGNATQAAISAGYKGGPAARLTGHRLITDVNISVELKERAARAAAAAELRTDGVLGVLRCLVHARAVDVLSKRQRMQLPPLTPELEVAIVGFKFDSKGKLREVKFADKSAAVEKAMRHLGMFDEENAQKGDVIRQFMEAISGHSRGLPTRRQSEKEESST
jgi:phage terminase small subunit